MPTHLIVAPAAAGKTHSMLGLCRSAARTGAGSGQGAGEAATRQPILCVSTALQRESAHRRLAQMGGALGVRILLFDDLYTQLLRTVARSEQQVVVELGEPVQFRLMRTLIDEIAQRRDFEHFAPLAEMPGFNTLARALIFELKAAAITPDAFDAFWRDPSLPQGASSGRVRDLARLYSRWQHELITSRWADRPGVGWMALEALRGGRAQLPAGWSPIIFDGFDSFTQVQLDLIAALHATHCCEEASTVDLYVTLTGDLADEAALPNRRAHRRFHRTRRRLEQALGVRAEPLQEARPLATWPPPLLHLTQSLFTPTISVVEAGESVAFVEASNRMLEVRAALRWIKQRIVEQGIAVDECALVARTIDPYLPHVLQVAEEFGIPLRLEGGLPLRTSPPVTALLALMRLLAPDDEGRPALPRRALVELWRSPYFDLAPFGVQAGDAELLDQAGRAGLVVGGLAQWRAALAAPAPVAAAGDEESEEGGALPPDAAQAQRLQTVFARFVERLTPPSTAQVRDYVALVESWLGAPPTDAKSGEQPALAVNLSVLARARAPGDAGAARDQDALATVRQLLSGLAWAAGALAAPPLRWADFVRDLAAAVEAAAYFPPVASTGAVAVAGLVQMRGVPLRALAVMGMAEGEIPLATNEDPFLRDEERLLLRESFPGINLVAQSAEYEFFLDTVARPDCFLLLTRPRLAEDGSAWEPSAFWQELHARLGAPAIEQVRSTTLPTPARAASLPELAQALGLAAAATPAVAADPAPAEDLADALTEGLAAIARAAAIVRLRAGRQPSPFDGDLQAIADETVRVFGPTMLWSPTALEDYRACGFAYLVGKALQLAPRVEPEADLSAATWGSIFHELLETVYRRVLEEGADAGDGALLRALLAEVAPAVLAGAPQKFGFRPPPWWPALQTEILESTGAALDALAALGGEPLALELRFDHEQPLLLDPEGAAVRVGGTIDRVDRLAIGSDGAAALRVVDYKSGVSDYNEMKSLLEGKKLQIALYAAAVEQALQLGKVEEGYYFFVRKAIRAKWGLQEAPGGVEGAIVAATRFAVEAALGARAGAFQPRPPEGGCPDYCPAAGFCWQYTPRASW